MANPASCLFWTVLAAGVLVIFMLLVAPHFNIYLTYK